MLRLRISLLAPLPPLKALFLVAGETRTIADLKQQLVRDLAPLAGRAPGEVRLEVDGWELLDGSTVELVREEDVISVKLEVDAAVDKPVPPPQASASDKTSQKKRKRSDAPEVEASSAAAWPTASTAQAIATARAPPSKKSKRADKAQPAPPVLTTAAKVASKKAPPVSVAPARTALPKVQASRQIASSSSASSSSSSGDDSDSDDDSSSESETSASTSSSSSDSDSSSSSSSSSSASSAPSVRTSKPPPSKPLPRPSSTIRLTPIVPDQPPVPPGEGSAATRERNLRRRKKKALLKAGLAAPGPAQAASPALAAAHRNAAKEQSADTEMEDVEVEASLQPEYLPTQRGQATPTPSSVAAARQSAQPTPELVVPFTVGANKNKSKAFRKAAMEGLSGFKTVFDQATSPATVAPSPVASATPTPTISAPSTPVEPRPIKSTQPCQDAPVYSAVAPPASYSTPSSAVSKGMNRKSSGRPSLNTPSTPRTYLPAPSARDPATLPKGMFVTSVDVEDAVWEATVGDGAWASYLGLEEGRVKEQVWEQGAMALDYGADELTPVGPGAPSALSAPPAPAEALPAPVVATEETVAFAGVDWDALERTYAVSSRLPWELLRVGLTILYKELILDPTTFSPSLALHVGTVTSLSELAVTLLVQVQHGNEAFEEDEEDVGLRESQLEEKVVSRGEWAGGDWRAGTTSYA